MPIFSTVQSPTLTDTTTVSAPTSTPAAIPAAAPTLRQRLAAGEVPSPFMAQAPATQTRAQAAYYNDVSLNDANKILHQAGQKAFDLSATLRRGAAAGELAAKQKAVGLTQQQVKGEQVSAMAGLASKMLAGGAQATAGGYGTHMRKSDNDTRRAAGAGLDSASQGGAIGNVITSVSDMTDKLAGGAHQADLAKIALKQNDVDMSIQANIKQNAQSGVDQASKVIDNALEAIKSRMLRVGELMGRIAGQ